MKIEEFFEWAWKQYLSSTPSVSKIVELLESHGEKISNDHIALRTFDHDKIKALKISEYFTQNGYVQKGEYDFPLKKVRAWHFEKKGMPKVFISELKLSEMSSKVSALIEDLIDQIPPDISIENLFIKDRPWKLDQKTYQELAEESEYASWVAAWGFEPNHFTILVNNLKKFNDLPKLNKLLIDNGFELNVSGGEIKGSPQVYLEQSSIMADKSMVEFIDGKLKIPSCYYEFAYRYPLETGELYEGFVAASADKIFESTNELGN